MWQRIQTVYLSLGILLNALIVYLSWSSWVADAIVGSVARELFAIYGEIDQEGQSIIFPSQYILVISLLSILLSVVIVLMYKRRSLQIKMAQLNLILQAGMVVGIFLSLDQSANSGIMLGEEFTLTYSMGTYLSLIPMIFIFLAIKAIKKDEALVRAADRIR
ncbi:MAG: hypothetical protein CMO34_07670 [Verrucomicrobia bacterium]|nr:hypothetical protein [Verrucomicrobiota bacterium]|tara:strand:- start:120 stop:605 length:486 start_codon:yes stop_codon:yes gene_type:complete